MEEVKIVETTAAEVAAEPEKKPRKKAKAQPVEETVKTVPDEQVPTLLHGVVTYYNVHTGVLGFECDGHGYQVPNAQELGFSVGDSVDFMIVDGKIVFTVA